MTLSAHAVVGTAVASLFPINLPAAFAVAFLSHYVMDAIPHRDYKLESLVSDGKNHLNDDLVMDMRFVCDFVKISADFGLGIILSLLLFIAVHPAGWPIVVVGIVGGVMPDGLQFVYMKTHNKILSYFQRVHVWAHFDEHPNVTPFAGFSLQAVIVAVIVCSAFLLSSYQLGNSVSKFESRFGAVSVFFNYLS